MKTVLINRPWFTPPFIYIYRPSSQKQRFENALLCRHTLNVRETALNLSIWMTCIHINKINYFFQFVRSKAACGLSKSQSRIYFNSQVSRNLLTFYTAQSKLFTASQNIAGGIIMKRTLATKSGLAQCKTGPC